MQNDTHTQNAIIDGAVAGGALTMPLWAVGLNEWALFFLHIGGAIIVAYRLWVMFQEIRQK